jgi:hypothetical protein
MVEICILSNSVARRAIDQAVAKKDDGRRSLVAAVCAHAGVVGLLDLARCVCSNRSDYALAAARRASRRPCGVLGASILPTLSTSASTHDTGLVRLPDSVVCSSTFPCLGGVSPADSLDFCMRYLFCSPLLLDCRMSCHGKAARD